MKLPTTPGVRSITEDAAAPPGIRTSDEKNLTRDHGLSSGRRGRFGGVSAEDVDNYLRGVEEPKRSTLQALRRTILEIVPDAEEVISYGVPAFRARGETVAGFAAFKSHLSYLPFSGSVLERLQPGLEGYTMTKSALHFAIDRPLPKALVEKLIAVRLGD